MARHNPLRDPVPLRHRFFTPLARALACHRRLACAIESGNVNVNNANENSDSNSSNTIVAHSPRARLAMYLLLAFLLSLLRLIPLPTLLPSGHPVLLSGSRPGRHRYLQPCGDIQFHLRKSPLLRLHHLRHDIRLIHPHLQSESAIVSARASRI